MSVFCEEFEKNMYDAYLGKVLLNGQVPRLGDYNAHEKVREQADALVHAFYHGLPLSNFEKDVEKKYLSLKAMKAARYSKR